MMIRRCWLFGAATGGLSLAAVVSLSGCDDAQTGSLKLGVSETEIDKAVHKLGNPGQSDPSLSKPGSVRTPAPSRR